MSRLDFLWKAHDRRAAQILQNQIHCPGDERDQAFAMDSLHTDSRNMGFCLAHLITCWAGRGSRFFHSPQVYTAIMDAAGWMCAHRRPSGCFDLSSCNFDSAPDTAFTVNQLVDAYDLLSDSEPEAEPVREALKDLILHACEGIAAGGFHTPNHRWAISASLLHGARITGHEAFAARARTYLQEGLDINQDGEFAERSTGIYNAVNDEQMLRIYLATEDVQYLNACRRNLSMMLDYIDPDGSLFTFNSTRQDYGHRVYPANYYGLFLTAGYLADDPSFAGIADAIGGLCREHGLALSGINWMLRFPELDTFGTDAPLPDLAHRHTSRIYEASGIGRWHRGSLCVTALAHKPNFLYLKNGSLTLGFSVYGNVCDRRNFIADTLSGTEHGFSMHSCVDSWYYLPFEGDQPDTTDWWAMNNPETRKRHIQARLQTDVSVSVEDNAVVLDLSFSGLDHVPARLEISVDTGCTVRSDSFVLTSNAGGQITVTQGTLEILNAEGDCFTIGPCFGAHNVLYSMGGAFQPDPGRFTIDLTAYTPGTHTLRIETRRRFPTVIPVT